MSTIAIHVEDAVARVTLDRPDKRNAINDDMRARLVHPSIQKRLQSSGWQHPMVLPEMLRFYASAALGPGWDQPSAEQLLAIAAEMGEGG